MRININARAFKVFGHLAWRNSKQRQKVISVFGKEAFPRLVLLEEKFYGAYLCYKRLKNRNKRYGRLKLTPKLLANSSLRTLHNDEYFFFTICNFIYKEIILLRKQGLLTDLSPGLLFQLKVLKEERRYHEHGKEWYWGEIKKGNPPVQSKGDNFDFDRNIKLLNEIYEFIARKVK